MAQRITTPTAWLTSPCPTSAQTPMPAKAMTTPTTPPMSALAVWRSARSRKRSSRRASPIWTTLIEVSKGAREYQRSTGASRGSP